MSNEILPPCPAGEQSGRGTTEPALTETIANAAVEIVAECRAMLKLPKGVQLTEAVRWIANGGNEEDAWAEYDALAEEYWACIRRDDMLQADGTRRMMDEQRQRIRGAALTRGDTTNG